MRSFAALTTCLVLIAWLTLTLGGCEQPSVPAGTVQAASDDPRLAAAVAEARQRWPEFLAAFSERKPGHAYAIKAGLPTKDGRKEHIWIQVTSIKGEFVGGTLDNEPIDDIGLQIGDPVRVKAAEIEDWLVSDGAGNVQGLFSMKVLEEIEREQQGTK